MNTVSHIKSDFLAYLIESNKKYMADYERWIFHNGMLFNSFDKWWGDKGKRPTPHEGIDLCLFECGDSCIKKLDENINVPASFSGEIMKIEKDFLGESIFIKHNIEKNNRCLYTLYGHLKPFCILGKEVGHGEIIGKVSNSSVKISPHIHISFAWVLKNLSPKDITWNNLADNPLIELIDPLRLIEENPELSCARKSRQ